GHERRRRIRYARNRDRRDHELIATIRAGVGDDPEPLRARVHGADDLLRDARGSEGVRGGRILSRTQRLGPGSGHPGRESMGAPARGIANRGVLHTSHYSGRVLKSLPRIAALPLLLALLAAWTAGGAA